MDKKYKKHYENMLKEYEQNNVNECNNNKIEFYKRKLKELKIKMEGSEANE